LPCENSFTKESIEMKKIMVLVMIASLSLTFLPASSRASTANSSSSVNSISVETAQANALLARLGEIKSMDKSNLSAPERKVLRKEVRGIQHQLNHLGGVIYISGAALILIIILLIILL
jgi:hypothetical protein